MKPEDYAKYKEIADKIDLLVEWGKQMDMPFMMSFGDDLCIDGHFTKTDLVSLAHKILEIFPS